MTYAKLRGLLAEWTDLDLACYQVGRVMDLFAEPSSFTDVRGLFFPSYPNDNGELLLRILDSLVGLGALEYRADLLQYRWAPGFGGLTRSADEDDDADPGGGVASFR
ncbi:MAG TPA: hypothetical protein VGX23_11935 [Actinocrinis sp.]|nr:hypothetical protein [Actinocrinis sp.]